MSEKKKDPLFVRSVEKAFKVLTAINQHMGPVTLKDVTRLTGYDKSAAQRFCHTLCELGYLNRVPGDRRYELAVRTTELGAGFVRSNEYIRHARPYLHALSIETEGSVTLSILDGNEVVFVSRFPGTHLLDTAVTVGSRLPIYCTATGRAAASQLDDEHLERILDLQKMTARTVKTETDRSLIRESILRCRSEGFVITTDQYVMSDLSLAVPLADENRGMLGAITLSLSTAHFNENQVRRRFVKLVQTTARAISS